MVRHLKGFDRVVIVGHRPDFLQNVFHIPADDKHHNNPDRNIFEKIMVAVDHERVSQEFICASDDHYLMHDFDARFLPYYHCGDIRDTIAKIPPTNYYHWHLMRTLNILSVSMLPTNNFNVHFPVKYEKRLFRKMAYAFSFQGIHAPLAKTLYANLHCIEGVLEDDQKIKTSKTYEAIQRILGGKKFFSTNEHSMNPEMLRFLQNQYPTPSRWEDVYYRDPI